MPDKRINAGYEIIKAYPVGDREFVLGENIYDGARYVTWECSGGNNYYWGHYFTDKESADKDLFDRIEAAVSFDRIAVDVAFQPDLHSNEKRPNAEKKTIYRNDREER